MRQRLETALLLILLVVIGLRPLIGETYSAERDPVSASIAGLVDPGLARTLWIDIVTLIAGGVALAASVRYSQRRTRTSGLEWGTLLFAVAATASCFVAGEKRPAIDASLDWVAALVTAAALVRLLDRPWRIALALIVISATGLANVEDCYEDHANAAATRQQYFENRAQIWASQNVPLDAPQVELFEHRMLANEASGFFAHSNVAGGYLLLGLFTALGLAAATNQSRARKEADRHNPPPNPTRPQAQSDPFTTVVAAILAAAFAFGIWLTHSTGALVAAIL
ncbi:MAG: hypothetical protein H6816_12020, partial [Phycisphaerales bacterium]|nr:hypothetical protein [Phycisphaerales bacterium]